MYQAVVVATIVELKGCAAITLRTNAHHITVQLIVGSVVLVEFQGQLWMPSNKTPDLI